MRLAAAARAADDNLQGYDPATMAPPPGKCGGRQRRQLPVVMAGAADGDGAKRRGVMAMEAAVAGPSSGGCEGPTTISRESTL